MPTTTKRTIKRVLLYINRPLTAGSAPLLAFIFIAIVGGLLLQREYNRVSGQQRQISHTVQLQRQQFDHILVLQKQNNKLLTQQQQQQQQLNEQQQGQEQAAIDTCIRLNKFFASINRNNYADYQFYLAAGNLLQGNSLGTSGFNQKLQQSVNAKTWFPVQACTAKTVANYHFPTPIRFSHKLPTEQDLVYNPNKK